MTVQYYHYREIETVVDKKNLNIWRRINAKGGSTIAVEVPAFDSISFLADLQTNATVKLKLSMGISVCNNADTYTKKTGRELSSARMREVELTRKSVSEKTREGHKNCHVVFTNGTIDVEFEIAPAIGKVRLLCVSPLF